MAAYMYIIFRHKNRHGFRSYLNVLHPIIPFKFSAILRQHFFSIMHYTDHNVNFDPRQYFQNDI